MVNVSEFWIHVIRMFIKINHINFVLTCDDHVNLNKCRDLLTLDTISKAEADTKCTIWTLNIFTWHQ